MENSISNKSNRQKKPVPTECKICGDSAIYSYFGVIACQSCKVFFRRTAKKGQEAFQCISNGDCQISVNTRHMCAYCRLAKCFNSGMQCDLIRSNRSTTNKVKPKRTDTTNQIETTLTHTTTQFSHYSIINILQSDRSIFTTDQWNLLSNLFNCYNEYNGLEFGERYIREQNNLPLKMRFKSATIISLYQFLFDEIHLLYKKNQDLLLLPSHDRSILLHNTIRYTTILSANFILHQIHLMDEPSFYETLKNITHSSIVNDIKCAANRFSFDIITMKLFLTIISISTINYTVYSNVSPVSLINITQILRIQSVYIDLTWRYLSYTCNFEQAIKYFSDLIRCLLSIQNCICKLEDIHWYTSKINSIIQQITDDLVVEN